MPHEQQPQRVRFECFELDLRLRELRKDGQLVKLQDQPARLLSLLASNSGQLVTRAEIEKALWGEDQIVEFEHSINTAMKKIREALGDDLQAPRFIETLPRKGYRFLMPVTAIENSVSTGPMLRATNEPGTVSALQNSPRSLGVELESCGASSAHDSPEEGFSLPRSKARFLFLVAQIGYLAMYAAALHKADAVEEALNRVLMMPSHLGAPIVLVSAMCGIAVRLYLITSVGFDHPAAGEKYLRLFPILFLLDILWAASPLLLAHTIGYGLSLGSVAGLAYLPFAQRVLMLSLSHQSQPAAGRILRT